MASYEWVVGRDDELAALAELLDPRDGGRGVVLVGGPGIGKSTLWEAALASVRERGVRVLGARPGGGEVRLSFAGLIDLCDPVGAEDLGGLPGPQRLALEAALLRGEPGGGSAEPTAVAFGFLGVVRGLAANSPVLIAIDDVQWLDAPSADVVAFAARRLEGWGVGFLLARRPGRIGALERVLAKRSLERLRVGPLSLGAVRRLLFERLGLAVSREVLRRIVDATEGNPLFALEVGRSLRERGGLPLDGDIPLPERVEEMLGTRVARLPAPVRRLLLAVALSEDPWGEQVAAIVGTATLDDAVDAGVVTVDGRRVRAAHPLLAAAAMKHSRAGERRELHRVLAAVAREEQVRVLHLALAATRADPGLAARLTRAADDARARGARRQALALSRHAVRVTPVAAGERAERVLALGELLDEVGELRRLTDLLEGELPGLPAGPMRARAWLLLSEGAGVSSIQEHEALLDRALGECGDDRGLRAYVLAKKADNAAAAAVSQLPRAEAWALEALADASDATAERYALYALAWARALTGRPIDDLCGRPRVTGDPRACVSDSPERVAGKRLLWRGELARARSALSALSALADERGEVVSYAMVRLHLCELELRAGDWAAAGRLLDEWAESSDYDVQFRPQYQRCRALLAAGRGDAGEAERWASEAIDRARAVACRWDELEARRARGLVALLRQLPERAGEDLTAVWKHCEREGVSDPGAFPVAPELVDALVESDELDRARAVSDRLRQLACEQEHPWGRASAKRCGALIVLASDRYDASTATTVREASADLDQLGLRFDSARCLLGLGRAQRRAKQWRAARETLGQASLAFAGLGSAGWVERARGELDRVGARRPRASGELTPTERRVAELAAEGLANKQIANAMFVTVHTVEVHLARVYAKLGVRSRAQLATRLTSGR